MNRRSFLSLSGSLGLIGLAGCGGLVETRQIPTVPEVPSDRPEAVYYPSHSEGMVMKGMATAGAYQAALSYSFPHRFWTVDGHNRNRVEISQDDTVHLMVRLWDADTDITIPSASLSIEISQDDEVLLERSPWPMLSQNMGFHFGDNVPLANGDGTYEITVSIGGLSTRRTGEFVDRFDEQRTLSFTLEYSEDERDDIAINRFPEKAGSRGAIEPMAMDQMPGGQLPESTALPGRVLGQATSGDAIFVAVARDSVPAGRDGDGGYLAISPRTPYNRYPLPFMSVSATVRRNGEERFSGPLIGTIDPQFGYHYGAVVEPIESGETLELEIGAPPQLARHEGYEMAFFDMEPMQIQVE